MNKDLQTFNHFVDDLLSSDSDLLKYELDLILMQYLFNSLDLKALKDLDIHEELSVAS